MPDSLQAVFAALELDMADVDAASGLVSRTPIDGSRLACIPLTTVANPEATQKTMRIY